VADDVDADAILSEVDMSTLGLVAHEPPKSVLEHIVWTGYVNGLGGHGGLGKSNLALTWAAHVAAGRGWAGLTVKQVPAVFVSLEDPGELVMHRLKQICDAFELSKLDVLENLTVLDGSQIDGTMALEKMEGGIKKMVATGLFAQLEVYAENAGLIIIDNASDAFGGNENERRQVRFFLRRLAKLAASFDVAVLLLMHVDKISAKHGSNNNTYSGSTAWHNTQRSRMAILEVDETIELHHEKCNLGPRIDPIVLDWQGAVLMPVVRDRVAESVKAEREMDQDSKDVLAAINAAVANDDPVPVALSGPRQAYHVLENYPELPKHLGGDNKGRRRLKAAITQLLRDKKLQRVDYTDDYRNKRQRLELTQPLTHNASDIGQKSALNKTPHTPQYALTHAGMSRVSTVAPSNEELTRTNALTQSGVDE
jgi:RecA-family ATPase